MKKWMSLLFLFFCIKSFSQSREIELDDCKKLKKDTTEEFEKIFTKVQSPAIFNDSTQTLKEYINKYFQLHPVSKRAKGQIILQLIINFDGQYCFSGVTVDIDESIDYLLLKQYMDKISWLPPKQNGRAVKSYKGIVIQFNGKEILVREIN